MLVKFSNVSVTRFIAETKRYALMDKKDKNLPIAASSERFFVYYHIAK